MDPAEQARFDTLLFAMTQAMKLHGLRDKTIDSYRRTLYRVAGHFGRCPDDLKPEELKEYFSAMVLVQGSVRLIANFSSAEPLTAA